MAIQKIFTKTDGTSGNFHILTGASFGIDSGRTVISVHVSSFLSAADRAEGKTPMKTKIYTVQASVFTAPQLNLLKTTLQTALVANEADLQGGSII